MLEGTLILVVTVILVIVVAAGVVAVLALSRRSADDWKGVIKREREEITQDVRTHSLPTCLVVFRWSCGSAYGLTGCSLEHR